MCCDHRSSGTRVPLGASGGRRGEGDQSDGGGLAQSHQDLDLLLVDRQQHRGDKLLICPPSANSIRRGPCLSAPPFDAGTSWIFLRGHVRGGMHYSLSFFFNTIMVLDVLKKKKSWWKKLRYQKNLPPDVEVGRATPSHHVAPPLYVWSPFPFSRF